MFELFAVTISGSEYVTECCIVALVSKIGGLCAQLATIIVYCLKDKWSAEGFSSVYLLICKQRPAM